jgi:integrase
MASKLRGKLTEAAVRRLVETGRLGRHCDGDGLYVQVANVSGRVTRSYLLRYVSPLKHPSGERFNAAGKLNPWVRDFGLDTADLATARLRAQEARNLLYHGVDPIEDRRIRESADKAKALAAVTFRKCAEDYIKSVAGTWRGGASGRQFQQWHQSLTDYTYPVIGALPVAMVDKTHVIAILKPIWETKTTTAERLRGRIESILDYAKGHALRSGDNPAAWKGNLDAVLARPSKLRRVEHLVAMPYVDVPAFMAKLRSTTDVIARAVELAVLTASRPVEVTGMCWSEVNLDAAIWIVPATRMKAGREHRVPLSDRAIEILKGLPRMERSAMVFTGRQTTWAANALALVKEVAGDAGLTLHGFRSTFRDWAGDCTSTQREVVEAALAHRVGDAAEQAYRRGDALGQASRSDEPVGFLLLWRTCRREGHRVQTRSLNDGSRAPLGRIARPPKHQHGGQVHASSQL